MSEADTEDKYHRVPFKWNLKVDLIKVESRMEGKGKMFNNSTKL